MTRSSISNSLLFAACLTAVAAGCEQKAPPPKKTAQTQTQTAPAPTATGIQIDSAKLSLFSPLPAEAKSDKNPITEEKIALGRMLYFDARLSKNHDVSCNSCHDLEKHGVDGKPFSEGHRKQKGDRNSPTVYNAALHFVQFWDGRAETIEDQAKGPVLNPVEMAMPDEKRVIETLESMPEYVEAFKKAFPDDENPVTFDNFAKAIGAFERRLMTPSRWDKYLSGDKTALSEDEKKGFLKFVEVGCTECHTGPVVGGTMYQKLGKVKPWPNTKDTGRRRETKSASDDMMFKVSGLRDVEHTAPYFHDATAATLEEAVKMMAVHQLGKELSEEDVNLIVVYLKALSGEIPTEYIKAPELPKSTPKTPKPIAL